MKCFLLFPPAAAAAAFWMMAAVPGLPGQTAGMDANAQAQAQAQAQIQAQMLSQQANALLANPALLFSQLDVDNDGLLNLNEFAPISQLSTQPLVVPGTAGQATTVQPNAAPVYTPSPGVRPVTRPDGTLAPSPGVPPVNAAPSPSLPATGRTLPQRPSP